MADAPRMPALTQPTRSVWHTAASALRALERLGVDADRISLESAGPGWVPGTVVRQAPAAGAALTPQTRVVLGVAGNGALESLPYALREEEPDGFGTDALFGLLDSPLRKLALHVAAAGGYFALHRDEPVTALRWIREVFQLDETPWPVELWHPLALLLPALHRLGGTADGVAVACRVVFDLPVLTVEQRTGVVPLGAAAGTRLGEAGGRLGIDAVAGRGVRAARGVRVTFGPCTIEQYLANDTPARAALRRILYRLVLPAQLADDVAERWRVGEAAHGARLGDPADPAPLGIGSYLGAPRPRSDR